jgi:hypothetical protein
MQVKTAPEGKEDCFHFLAEKADFGRKKGHFAPKSPTCVLIPLDLTN